MKKIILVLLMCALCLASCEDKTDSAKETDTVTDKAVDTESVESDSDTDGFLTDEYGKYKPDYDTDNKEVKRTYYDSSNNATWWREFEYNTDGNMVMDTHYSENGNLSKKYEYSTNGVLIKTTFYSATANVSMIYEYNTDGILTKETFYNSDGSLSGWNDYEYTTDGKPAKKTCYSADGTVSMICEYDTYGGWIETRYNNLGKSISYCYNADGSNAGSIIYKYSNDKLIEEVWYNAEGNFTKIIEYNTDGSVSQWSEYVLDADGNTIKKITYNADGSIKQVYEY